MIDEVKKDGTLTANKIKEIISEVNSLKKEIEDNLEKKVVEILKKRIKISKISGVPAIRIE